MNRVGRKKWKFLSGKRRKSELKKEHAKVSEEYREKFMKELKFVGSKYRAKYGDLFEGNEEYRLLTTGNSTYD